MPESEDQVSLQDLVGPSSNKDLYKDFTIMENGVTSEVFVATNSKTNKRVAIKKSPLLMRINSYFAQRLK